MKDKLMDFFGYSVIVLGVVFVTTMSITAIYSDGRNSAAAEACLTLGGAPVGAYPSGIVCLDKSAVKTP